MCLFFFSHFLSPSVSSSVATVIAVGKATAGAGTLRALQLGPPQTKRHWWGRGEDGHERRWWIHCGRYGWGEADHGQSMAGELGLRPWAPCRGKLGLRLAGAARTENGSMLPPSEAPMRVRAHMSGRGWTWRQLRRRCTAE